MDMRDGEIVSDQPRLNRNSARRRNASFAVLIVAVVLLSGLSISYYSLSKHYHDAKYRAQHELVTSLVADLGYGRFTLEVSGAQRGISVMINDSYLSFVRLEYCRIAISSLQSAAGEAQSIAVMYPNGSLEWRTFENLSDALEPLHRFILQEYRDNLWEASFANASYETNDTVRTLFRTVGDEMASIVNLLNAGFDKSRDWHTEPYSLVKRMDLAAIDQSVNNLVDATSQLWRVYMNQ